VIDTKQINETLDRLFNEEGQRIIFWNDPEQEFLEFMDRLPFLTLGKTAVNILRLDKIGALKAKIQIERESPTGRFLLYSHAEEPDYESDWLLDIRLYSRNFRADKASIILDELGLANQHLRQHLAERRKFFDNKERLQKLKPLIAVDDTAADIDRKIISIVVKAEQPEFFNIIRSLFHTYTENGEEINLDSMLPVWDQIENFDLAKPFWEITKASFGYSDENEDPSLKKLLIRLSVTDYAYHLGADLPLALHHLVLPPSGRANAIVCLAQWRDSASRGSSYDRLSGEVAKLIRLEDHLQGLESDDLLNVMTFLEVEKSIASSLRERVENTADTINVEEVRAVATRRQAGHWASPNVIGAIEVPRKAYYAVYDALVAAAEFFALRNQHQQGFDFPDAQTMYHAYKDELYRFDQLYRHFYEAADQAESQGWNILKPLRDAMEGSYTNWYVSNLALSWGKFIEPNQEASLLKRWQIGQVPNQYRFYETNIRPRLQEAETRKAYVIISDAFRYEAAQELARELNGKYRFEATLALQLGVLPSFTSLGIASLLPHETLTFKPNGEVLVDGKPTNSLDQRNEILKDMGGMACSSKDLMAMKKDEGREFVSGKRVVYVFHNKIDAVGDDSKTEDSTLEAVRLAINELASLVTYIINNLNGNYIVITADHGFLFTKTAPTEPDKSKLEEKPEGTVKAKKRYLIGLNLPEHEAVWHGKTAITARAEGGMEFWIPKAANRFHFVGGARFIHGGAMLQEIVVPVVIVKHIKGKSVKETKTKTVTVRVLGGTHKITTNRHRFELIQMEAVGDRVKPITLKVAVYEGDEPVTNTETVIFDSISDKMDERRKWVNLVLQDREYNKKTSYRLVLRDAETGIEEQSVPVVIDRAFYDDF